MQGGPDFRAELFMDDSINSATLTSPRTGWDHVLAKSDGCIGTVMHVSLPMAGGALA